MLYNCSVINNVISINNIFIDFNVFLIFVSCLIVTEAFFKKGIKTSCLYIYYKYYVFIVYILKYLEFKMCFLDKKDYRF